MATPQTNVRLSPGIKSQAVAAAAAEEISLSQFVERALVAWLSGECTGADTARDTGAGTALALIPELVSRVEAIERSLLGIPRSEPAPPGCQQAAPRSVQVSGHPTDEHEIRAVDGQRWLSAEQGYQAARARGYSKAASSFRRDARQQSGMIEQRYGLRRLHRPQGDTKSAAYEDVRWGE